VVSTISSQPPMIADELRRQADVFTDLVELQSKLGRDPSERLARASRVITRRNSYSSGRPPGYYGGKTTTSLIESAGLETGKERRSSHSSKAALIGLNGSCYDLIHAPRPMVLAFGRDAPRHPLVQALAGSPS
jgi:hypothetical protein